MQEQITALEIRIAYQDKTIAALDEVVREFTARIEALEARVARLAESQQRGQPEIGPHHDPPPHY